jgi:DNA polymerase (family 10)
MARDIDFVIDTDSHHVSDLVRMDYGVSYAQRGWVTSDRVANAKPMKKFLTWAAKRR